MVKEIKLITTKQNTMKKENTTPTKEGLHTQGEKWEVHSTGSLPAKAEIHPANDPDGLIIIADVYKYEDAELIVTAVNERQALLDSHRELLAALIAVDGFERRHEPVIGTAIINQVRVAINNAKNIKQ